MKIDNKDSITLQILKCAQEKFLQSGYTGTSLNEICRTAGVTTGAFYKRFFGKEDLFETIVTPVALEYKTKLTTQWEDKDTSILPCWSLKFFYSHREVFYLLTQCQSVPFGQNYLLEIVEIVSRNILSCYGNRIQLFPIIQLMVKTYLQGMIEIIHSDLKFEEAQRCVEKLNLFVNLQILETLK